ncbi:MAG TPA: protein-export chaperone SecB [Gammaproteobacteria bacterium]|nr:protein-export chaperone SecB [Gammaproteobacteria bacterium]
MSDIKTNPDNIAPGEKAAGIFTLQKIYTKDISFETPNSPQIFQEQWKPTVNLDIGNTAKALGKDHYEVVLAVTITVSFEEKSVYLIEVHQAGIFQISGFNEEGIGRMVATHCPNILFPFAREVVSDLVVRGGFPQLLLAPINFEALYLQKLAKQAEQAQDAETRH